MWKILNIFISTLLVMSLTACGPERTEIALKESNNDDERENQAEEYISDDNYDEEYEEINEDVNGDTNEEGATAEEVVANTDIASYITGDYFDIEG